MWQLANDPKEWHDPSSFLPDRFNPDSPLFLTPSNKRRNNFTHAPFFGGQRICIGKTFVEVISKLTLPTLWVNFDFSLPTGTDRESFELPFNNLISTFLPKVNVCIKQKSTVQSI